MVATIAENFISEEHSQNFHMNEKYPGASPTAAQYTKDTATTLNNSTSIKALPVSNVKVVYNTNYGGGSFKKNVTINMHQT